ncbi:MAG: hypothetical protein RL745_855, partial [Actinomycetota bacterium]
MPQVRITLAQINTTVGAIDANCERILAAVDEAGPQTQIVVFPEMAVTGYPLEDLALRRDMQTASVNAVRNIAQRLLERGRGDAYVVVGHIDLSDGFIGGRPAPRNCVSVLHAGEVIATYAKRHLPNYGVFDEYRIFQPGDELCVLEIQGARVGIAICEDLWQGESLMREYRAAGIDILVVPNASPFERDKDDARTALLSQRAREAGCPIVYVNSVGGQDELVFDGGSFLVNADGEVVARLPQFVEQVTTLDDSLTGDIAAAADDLEQVWSAIVVGIRDYVHKNG